MKLNSGVTYKGILAGLDGFMNLAMEQTSTSEISSRQSMAIALYGNNGKFDIFLLFSLVCSLTTLHVHNHRSAIHISSEN